MADFYRGKTVRFVVGFAPGGAFDVYSRFLARYMPKYLPGNPTMVVENKPGAGSVLAANMVYNTEPKDGTVIGSFNEFLVLQQLMGAAGIQFDSGKFNWLGSSTNTFGACLVRSDSGVNTIQDLLAGKEVAFGTTGLGAATHDIPAVINSALGTKFKLVPGYDGISKVQLALDSKEVDGYCVSFDSMQIVARNTIEANPPGAKIVLVMGDRTPDHAWLKDVPAAETLARTDEAKLMLRTIHGPSRISKPFAVAPEVPKERVEALRWAMAMAFADKELQDEGKKANLEITPSGGESVTTVIRELTSTPRPIVEKLQEILK